MLKEIAVTKWCPMARVNINGNGSANRAMETQSEEDATYCMADGCMMWVPLPSADNDVRGYCGMRGAR